MKFQKNVKDSTQKKQQKFPYCDLFSKLKGLWSSKLMTVNFCLVFVAQPPRNWFILLMMDRSAFSFKNWLYVNVKIFAYFFGTVNSPSQLSWLSKVHSLNAPLVASLTLMGHSPFNLENRLYLGVYIIKFFGCFFHFKGNIRCHC